MTANDVTNWIAIYLLTFYLSAVCAILSAITITVELYRERVWHTLDNTKNILLFLPRIWWRWQKRYLLGTPVILAIVLAFSIRLTWTTQW